MKNTNPLEGIAMSLQRLLVLRSVSVLLLLCLLSATSAPTLAWACEGAAYEYQGEEAGKQIAAGHTVAKVVAGYQFENGAEKKQVSCKEEYTWKKQGPAKKFIFKPAYEKCGWNGVEAVPNINVGACEYQFNAPAFVKANEWTTSLSIINAGCEVKMKMNAEACEVKIKNEAANENVNTVFESNNGKNLQATSVVTPLKFKAAGVCEAPIGLAGTTLEYISGPELENVNIK